MVYITFPVSTQSSVHGVEQQQVNKLADISKWWHVNKGGFPIAADTWDKMWYYVRQVHPDGEQVEATIRGGLQAKVCIQCMINLYNL